MFSLVTGLYHSYFTPESISLLIIGCDGVGKTAFLERCKITKFSERRFAPSSITVGCRAGKFGRSSVPVRGIYRLKQSPQQRRNSAVPEPLNMEMIRPTGRSILHFSLSSSCLCFWLPAGLMYTIS
jgi:GTPase SAR1 family protein